MFSAAFPIQAHSPIKKGLWTGNNGMLKSSFVQDIGCDRLSQLFFCTHN